MNGALSTTTEPVPGGSAAGLAWRVESTSRAICFHCGEPCADVTFTHDAKTFCCRGCLLVHDVLAEAGLDHFYRLNRHPGVRIRNSPGRERWTCLDDPQVRSRFLDFADGKLSRATFHIPAIHCVACVWLLENLHRLRPGIGAVSVRFERREATFDFDAGRISLSELAALLTSIGYEPAITLDALGTKEPRPARRRQWLQLGIAGFAFGNIMLFSLPGYFGLDSASGPAFRRLFGYLSLVFALPVLLYSAADYWKSARLSLRQRTPTLDVPIVLGIAALYLQSAWEILSGSGAGYLDSLVGLIFLLLCGKAFQRQTYERLSFDRDFKSFFPLSVRRRTAEGEKSATISDLRVGDRVVLRNGELIPADATLLRGEALIDYSFVTGESEPLRKSEGDYLYAGGKQVGESIEMEIVKPVSQSYLTSLWNHEAFRKGGRENFDTLTNRYSRWFIGIVISLALGSALFWLFSGNATRALKAFASVLIVACPCALALAAPFALGTARRVLSRIGVFVRNPEVIEALARADTILFDKTGTLTCACANEIQFEGRAGDAAAARETSQRGRRLEPQEEQWVYSLATHSTHPHSLRICELLDRGAPPLDVGSFLETPGCGIEGSVRGHRVLLGSEAWLAARGMIGSRRSEPASEERFAGTGPAEPGFPTREAAPVSAVHVAIDGCHRGAFTLGARIRPGTEHLLQELKGRFEVLLASGDTDRQRPLFGRLFAGEAQLNFKQGPLDKLALVRRLQEQGKRVIMVGDGLNDAGALKQSDIGIAVVEKIGAFSPASDVILEGRQVPNLGRILRFARSEVWIVRMSFGISAVYNLVGIGIAAAGILSPVICAVLMPLSSISVVAVACAATHWAARRAGLAGLAGAPETAAATDASAQPQPAL